MLGGATCDVLILDDEPEVANAIATMLRDEGLACCTENDPACIADRVREPRVLLLDLCLPDGGVVVPGDGAKWHSPTA